MELIKKTNGTVELIISQPVTHSTSQTISANHTSGETNSGVSVKREGILPRYSQEEQLSYQSTPSRDPSRSQFSNRQITEAEVQLTWIVNSITLCTYSLLGEWEVGINEGYVNRLCITLP